MLYEMIIELFAMVGISVMTGGFLWLILEKIGKPKSRIVIHFKGGKKIKLNYNEELINDLILAERDVMFEFEHYGVRRVLYININNVEYWETITMED